jgi:6-phosphogluconolactonase
MAALTAFADQTNQTLSSYTINPSNGALTLLSSVNTRFSPTVVTLDPTGAEAPVAEGGSLQYFQVSLNAMISGGTATYNLGATTLGLSIDPTSQYLSWVKTGNLACVYTLEPSILSGYPCYDTGNSPSAVFTEPSGRFVYVANSSDGTISAYSLANSTGVLTPITGTFTTGSGPASLAASNDGKYLYAVNNGSGTVSIFTINNDGTLNAAGSAITATGPTSIATVGTYK